ncbi:hypothetical protein BJX66DRAFT_219935 [Aspergillus keveii]|uniref:Xylanolytic transcriptional activator regulatory domain-containing protein n=1 Tax=Aspergillus keveii TaxID=714993 RepID=A0ABR4G434_9EURO
MGHIILQPSVESVQALLLFSITLRLRDQLSQAWDGLTLAISMSRTIKFRDLSSHSQSIRQTMAESDKDPASTWWALYVFEKFLAFDSGRKACLDDPRLSAIGRKAPMEPSDHNRAPGSKLGQYEHHVTSLANVLHEMQQRSWHTWRTENLDTTAEMDARASKIRAAGAIDMMLSKWRGALPPEYQIGTSGSADVQLTPQWALLSFYYHQAIITLYRNTLLLDWTEVKAEVDRFGSGEPWHLRIRNAPQICLEAAKETINLQVMATEAGEPSYVSIGTSPLAAAYVLAIYIRRQPASILSRTHSEFMRAAIAISRQRYASHSAEGALNKALDMLQEYVAQLIGDAAASRSSVELNPDGNHRTLPMIGEVIPNSLNSPEYPWASFELLDWDWNELIPQT